MVHGGLRMGMQVFAKVQIEYCYKTGWVIAEMVTETGYHLKAIIPKTGT